ncbi:MAG: glutathione-disulfide reductase [Porticoccaceae bacterium]|nr:glutathione-disulfide reductase [Porticoccaceae bacterium]
MAEYEYDLFVIGAGSGGVRAARMSAQYGGRVAVAEHQALGGTCVNVGCVPKKLFVYASEFSHAFSDSAGFGWQNATANFHWPTLRENKNREIERLNAIYKNLLETPGVDIVEGRAVIVDPHTVAVNGREYSCRDILICTGGYPYVPEFPGSEYVINSNDAFFLDELPSSIVVVGGGYIGVEFAGIFNGLGVKTHLVYRGDLFLKAFDQDLRTHLAEEMTKQGVHVHFNEDIESIKKTEQGFDLSLKSGDSLQTGLVMYATGRKPNTHDLGLENTKVSCDSRGYVQVNDALQTAEPSIYALGDVIGRVELTPVAIKEGMALAGNLFKGESNTIDYNNIPTAVFSQPNLGTVGLTEAEARASYDDILIYRSEFRPMKATLSGGSERALMKIIVDASTDKVIGCHMLGDGAGEIIQGLAVAIKCGATKADFDATVGIHPTAAEEFVTMR